MLSEECVQVILVQFVAFDLEELGAVAKELGRAAFIGLHVGEFVAEDAVVALAAGGEGEGICGGAVEDEEDFAVGLEEVADALGGAVGPLVVAVCRCVAVAGFFKGCPSFGRGPGVVIAGEMAATHYGLTLLASNIEDEPNNTTRFLVLGNYEPKPSNNGKDKTSLVLSAANRAGAVYEMLTPFAKRGVSMSKFESRPSKVAMWEYLFFVDIDGHREDANVVEALAEVRSIAGYVKVLGSYPAAVL